MPAISGRRAALHRGVVGIALLLGGTSVRAQGTNQAPTPSRPLRLLMLGDSITAGYGLPAADALPVRLQEALRARGRNVTVINAGVSGDTTAGGRARLDWSLAERPDAVIVALGGNDVLRGIDPRATRANLTTILDRLRDRGLPAMLAGMLSPPNLGADYARELDAVFRDLGGREGVVSYAFLLEGVATNPAMNQPDRIHPNQRGVAELVRRMLPAVETLLDRVRPA